MDSILIRFPDGTKEFRFPGKPIVEGDTIWHDGEHWRVIKISPDGGHRDVAIVERASDDLSDLLVSEEGAVRLELV